MTDEASTDNVLTPTGPTPVAVARALTKTYHRGGALGRGAAVRALDGASLEVHHGELHALVGVSGSGKSTLARCLTLHERADAGELQLAGRDPWRCDRTRLAILRRQHQLLIQQPSRAMHRSWTAAEIVAEPLRIAGVGRAEREQRVAALLHDVELRSEHASRRPDRLSGGQRQRLAIARALATEPRLLVLDEGLTGLDLPLRARLLTLLLGLRQSHSLTLVLVTHDLRLAGAADRVAVLDGGRIVESTTPQELLARPVAAASRRLVAATRQLASARP